MIPTALVLALSFAAADRPDRVVADFEGDTYGDWVAAGDAFGPGPARGTLPGQMEVTGFLGRGLINSFRGGDKATGTLTSPGFTVERPYLNFLIGGGGYAGETCLNLLIDGAVVRSAVGPNTSPGGSERLEWASWDVSNLVGKTVVLQVVDRHTGGWGHLNVDQIVQSDRPRGERSARRDITADRRYLHLPVGREARPRRVKIVEGGRTVREFDIRLAEGPHDFKVFADLAPFHGKELNIETRLPESSRALDSLKVADDVPGADRLYREARRPQFHFTSGRGWLNDPNGLVYHDGEYHLFYQHNPYGWDWGNMHWGHAVSPDLVHWTELPDALTPRAYGDWCFSGSAVVDTENTSGFGRDGAPPLVLAYTSTARGECIACSTDRGRTWTEYEGNPVVKHRGRDPRLLWHVPSKRWVMAVYDEEGGRQAIAFHTSPDLKTWTYRSRIDGFYECPDLFEIAEESDPVRKTWVLYAADGRYVLGRFDGERFTAETPRQTLWYGDFYAAQTYSNAPDGRRIQVGWARGVAFPGMPFNQQMTAPCELRLARRDGVQFLTARPVKELGALRRRHHERTDLPARPDRDALPRPTGELLAVRVEAVVGAEGGFTLAVHGRDVVYDAAKRTTTCSGVTAPLAPEGDDPSRGLVELEVLADRGSIEVFGGGGRIALSRGITPVDGAPEITLSGTGEGTRFMKLSVDELDSSWETRR